MMGATATMTRENGNKRTTSVEDLGWSQNLLGALQAFRMLDPDISANQVVALLMIAREPGISQSELADKNHLNITTGTAARICAVLSDRGNRGTPGKGLIEIGHAAGDYRTTAQYVTRKGAALLKTVRDIMER
jgi:DNA-binding MarR family transcriptional regulator